MRNFRPLMLVVMSLCLAIGACSKGNSVELTQPMKALLKKNQSLGLTKFPISFWNYCNLAEHGKHMTEAEVASWADAGFTVPQSPRFDAKNAVEKAQISNLLKWADKRGMKMIVADPRGWAKAGPDGKPAADYAEGIRSAVADFGKSPALFGFQVGDEPHAAFKDTFFECCRIQKEIAPNLHPFANLLPQLAGIESAAGTDTWPNYLDEYAKKTNADLVGYDCYVQMNPGDAGWHDYYRNLRFHRESALRNGIPFWNTILCVGHYSYRCPNLDEIRWQFNTSIAAGANGISWFFYYMQTPEDNYRLSPVDEFWEKTQTYYDIRRVQRGFHKRYEDLFNRLVSTRVSFAGSPYGGIEAFTPNDIIKGVALGGKSGMLIGEFTDIQGKRYAMFVSNSMTESQQYHVTFPKNARLFSQDWYGNEYEGPAYNNVGVNTDKDGNAVHSVYLAPGQEVVYRVEIGK